MKYTPELVEELIKYIRAGNYQKTACEIVGISEDTFIEWKKTKSEFSELIKKAEAEAIARNLTIIQLAASKEWQAAAWFLERKDFKNWGRKELIGGITDEPIKLVIEHVAKKDTSNKGL